MGQHGFGPLHTLVVLLCFYHHTLYDGPHFPHLLDLSKPLKQILLAEGKEAKEIKIDVSWLEASQPTRASTSW